MISSVIFTGLVKNKINSKFRYIETHSSDALHPDEDIVSLIPTMFWTRDEINPLMNAKENQFVIIQGHLESNKEIGLYILVETIQIGNIGQIK